MNTLPLLLYNRVSVLLGTCVRQSASNLIDGRNFLDRNVLEQAGFNYIGIGRAASPTQPNISESKLVTTL
jgi:hypothetical protein